MDGSNSDSPENGELRDLKTEYLEATKLIERLHRQFLEVVKTELDRRETEDINNIQALILFNIGSEELTVGGYEPGYYLGSNVSYNVRKMVENGYLVQERSPHDHGLDLCGFVEMFHAVALQKSEIGQGDLKKAADAYRDLERFWIDAELQPSGRPGPLGSTISDFLTILLSADPLQAHRAVEYRTLSAKAHRRRQSGAGAIYPPFTLPVGAESKDGDRHAPHFLPRCGKRPRRRRSPPIA